LTTLALGSMNKNPCHDLPFPRDYEDALKCEIEDDGYDDDTDDARRRHSTTDGNGHSRISTYVCGVGVSVCVYRVLGLQVGVQGKGGAQKLGKGYGQTYQSLVTRWLFGSGDAFCSTGRR